MTGVAGGGAASYCAASAVARRPTAPAPPVPTPTSPRSVPLARLAPAALLALAACSAGDGHAAAAGEVAPAAAPAAAPADTAPWTPREVSREQGDCGDSRPESRFAAPGCTTVRIAWPEVAATPHPALGDSARAFVRDYTLAPVGDESPSTSAEAVAAAFLTIRNEAARTEPAEVGGWTLQRVVTVACNDAERLSLRAEETLYSGGAHGMQAARLVTFDARTGRRLRLADVAPDLAHATAAAERRFRQQREIPAGQSLPDAGYVFFENDRFALTENFHRCGGTVTFRYDPYEIAPYALGATELVVPLGELGVSRP